MDITLGQTTLLPIIVALVGVVKGLNYISNKWLPVVAMVLGVLGVWTYTGQLDWVFGVVIGLSSVGLYSGVKSAVK